MYACKSKTTEANIALAINANQGPTEDQTTKQYLQGRLTPLYWEKAHALGPVFNLNHKYISEEDKLDRALTGRYQLRDEQDYDDDSGELIKSKRVIWKTKEEEPNREGYNAAKKLLDAAKQKAEDEINVYFPEQGLESLRTFEAYDAVAAWKASLN